MSDQFDDVSVVVDTEEFKTALDSVKSNPDALKTFLENQKNLVLSEVEEQKAITFDKAYGDLNYLSKSQDSMILLDQRTKQLDHIQEQISSKQGNELDNVNDDKHLAKRKVEMNEWSVENKKETLFIYSMFFILITVIIFLSALLNMGAISTYLFTSLVVPLVIIFILTLIYRVRLTTNYRNKRYWNRRSFDESKGKLRFPNMSICPESA